MYIFIYIYIYIERERFIYHPRFFLNLILRLDTVWLLHLAIRQRSRVFKLLVFARLGSDVLHADSFAPRCGIGWEKHKNGRNASLSSLLRHPRIIFTVRLYCSLPFSSNWRLARSRVRVASSRKALRSSLGFSSGFPREGSKRFELIVLPDCSRRAEIDIWRSEARSNGQTELADAERVPQRVGVQQAHLLRDSIILFYSSTHSCVLKLPATLSATPDATVLSRVVVILSERLRRPPCCA